MPELCDVEGQRRRLDRFAVGRSIEGIELPDTEIVRNADESSLRDALLGASFTGAYRHGKWLVALAESHKLLVHFGMTGLLVSTDSGESLHRHDRAVFSLDDGQLRYRNQRRLGGLWLTSADSPIEQITGPIGPDAQAVSKQDFAALVSGRRAHVKAILMDQSAIAGIGNLLSDEILWRAYVHPKVRGDRVADHQGLYKQMRKVLSESARRGQVPQAQGWLQQVRERSDASCPRCATAIERAKVAGRTACLCPRCQPAPN